MVKLNFTEHNPSATISVGDEEWVQCVAWISDNWDIIGGLSFLPRENHVYRLAPYESIDKKTYEELAAKFPKVDYSKLIIYERTFSGRRPARRLSQHDTFSLFVVGRAEASCRRAPRVSVNHMPPASFAEGGWLIGRAANKKTLSGPFARR